MDALETKGRVGLHRWPRESCCTWGDSRFASSRQLVCDKSKDGNPMTLILIRFLNQPPAARFFCCASRPGGNEGRRKPPTPRFVVLLGARPKSLALLCPQPGRS